MRTRAQHQPPVITDYSIHRDRADRWLGRQGRRRRWTAAVGAMDKAGSFGEKLWRKTALALGGKHQPFITQRRRQTRPCPCPSSLAQSRKAHPWRPHGAFFFSTPPLLNFSCYSPHCSNCFSLRRPILCSESSPAACLPASSISPPGLSYQPAVPPMPRRHRTADEPPSNPPVSKRPRTDAQQPHDLKAALFTNGAPRKLNAHLSNASHSKPQAHRIDDTKAVISKSLGHGVIPTPHVSKPLVIEISTDSSSSSGSDEESDDD